MPLIALLWLLTLVLVIAPLTLLGLALLVLGRAAVTIAFSIQEFFLRVLSDD